MYSALPFCINVPISDLFAFLCLLSFRFAFSFVPWPVCSPRLVLPAAASRGTRLHLLKMQDEDGHLATVSSLFTNNNWISSCDWDWKLQNHKPEFLCLVRITVGFATKKTSYQLIINTIRMLQQTRRNTIGRSTTSVRMTFRACPLWLERQSSSLLPFVRFGYHFSSVICLFAPLALKMYFFNFFATQF